MLCAAIPTQSPPNGISIGVVVLCNAVLWSLCFCLYTNRDAVWGRLCGPKESCIIWVHMGATWQIWLNDPCSAAMRTIATIRPNLLSSSSSSLFLSSLAPSLYAWWMPCVDRFLCILGFCVHGRPVSSVLQHSRRNWAIYTCQRSVVYTACLLI